MVETLDGPRAKIERAKKHILEFEAAVDGLVFSSDAHPHVIAAEQDHDSGRVIYKLVHLPSVPHEVIAVAGDAIHNLRSALDLLMSQLVKRRTGGLGELHYPTAWNRKGFEARCASEVKPRVHEDALQLVRASEVYRGGLGDAAWRVHRLDIEDKHRVIYELGFCLSSVTLALPAVHFDGEPEQSANFTKWMVEMMDGIFWFPAKRMFPLKQGDVLQISPPEPANNPKFRLEVAFGQPQIVQAEPTLPALVQFSESVETIVESFSALF